MNLRTSLRTLLLAVAVAYSRSVEAQQPASRELRVSADSLVDRVAGASTTVRLRFQLILASETPGTDASLSALESALRDITPARGYRLLGQGATLVEDGGMYVLAILTSENERFAVRGSVKTIRVTGNAGTMNFTVNVSHAQSAASERAGMTTTIFGTGLSIPLGHLTVIGSSATTGAARTLLFTVRAEPVQ